MINTTNKILLTLLAVNTLGLAIANKPHDVVLNAAESNNKIELTNIPIAETIKPAVLDVTTVVPIPRPKYNPNYCPRTEDGRATAEPTVIVDDSIPQHCLERNCGLGVYSKRAGEPDGVERCSYCDAQRPVNL